MSSDRLASRRLVLAGDTHGNLAWIRTLIGLTKRSGCTDLVVLGDFGFWPDQKVWRAEKRIVLNERFISAVASTAEFHGVLVTAIDGNHDFHPGLLANYVPDSDGVASIRPGVVQWATRGAVWEWGGVRFGALGGAHSIDSHLRTEGENWWSTEAITDEDVDALIRRADGRAVDVLLSHDCPAGVSIPGIKDLPGWHGGASKVCLPWPLSRSLRGRARPGSGRARAY
jgi:predicted phosphodiesterase